MVELLTLFCKGFIIGLSLAVVVGPIAILCMQQTLVHGFYAGIACGLGVATADGLYGAIAGLGLSFITELLAAYQFWLQLGGGFLLCYLGIVTFRRTISTAHAQPTATRLLNMYISTCMLTLSNPMTLIPLSALLAALEISSSIDRSLLMMLLFAGFFCGSLIWWIILTTAITFLKTHISRRTLDMINKITGILICMFGLSILASLYWITAVPVCVNPA
ncbi:LysE family transporter [Candidatus Dependentiae bacterium]|nr:LysE family transporter [Candidatus Dependentiae bacterium]MCC7414502.1 LysE family transporter [Campylobacterota bacterium]